MKSIAEIITGTTVGTSDAKKALWQSAVRASEDEFRRQRPWKVTLCVMIFSEVEVVSDMYGVERLAEKSADDAKVVLHTAPAAMRLHVQRRSDPKNPESPLEWTEVVHGPIDPLDPGSPWAWQFKK